MTTTATTPAVMAIESGVQTPMRRFQICTTTRSMTATTTYRSFFATIAAKIGSRAVHVDG